MTNEQHHIQQRKCYKTGEARPKMQTRDDETARFENQKLRNKELIQCSQKISLNFIHEKKQNWKES